MSEGSRRAAIIELLMNVPWTCDYNQSDRRPWEQPGTPACDAGTCVHWKDTPHYGRMADAILAVVDREHADLTARLAEAEQRECDNCGCTRRAP